MCTLICKGIEAFIVVKSQFSLLGVEVFFLWDSTLSNPKRDGQTFPYRAGFSLRRIF